MMSSTRVSRCGAVTLAAVAAFSLAACGSSSTSSGTSTGTSSTAASTSAKSTTASSSPSAPASSPAPSAEGRDRTFGIVGTVSGTTITLTEPNGPATVDFTTSTRVTQVTPAQLTDVTAGDCLVVRPTKDTAGSTAVTAVAVLFGQPQNGQCAPSGPHKGRGVIGTVVSVSGNAIMLTTGDSTPATVTVTPNTRYAMRATGNSSAIAAGQCLMAQGAKEADGSLQATSINIRPSDNGKCGGRHQGG